MNSSSKAPLSFNVSRSNTKQLRHLVQRNFSRETSSILAIHFDRLDNVLKRKRKMILGVLFRRWCLLNQGMGFQAIKNRQFLFYREQRLKLNCRLFQILASRVIKIMRTRNLQLAWSKILLFSISPAMKIIQKTNSPVDGAMIAHITKVRKSFAFVSKMLKRKMLLTLLRVLTHWKMVVFLLMKKDSHIEQLEVTISTLDAVISSIRKDVMANLDKKQSLREAASLREKERIEEKERLQRNDDLLIFQRAQNQSKFAVQYPATHTRIRSKSPSKPRSSPSKAPATEARLQPPSPPLQQPCLSTSLPPYSSLLLAHIKHSTYSPSSYPPLHEDEFDNDDEYDNGFSFSSVNESKWVKF